METVFATAHDESVESRIVRTLTIADRWGYALRGEDLARFLYGGAEQPLIVEAIAARCPTVAKVDGFFVLRGRENLAAKSFERRESNGALQQQYRDIASDFARDLLRQAPFVRSVCISGSVASGGVTHGDDVDLNILTETGTKYLTYLVALALGLIYSLRHGTQLHGRGLLWSRLSKTTCINVIWDDVQARPFVRQDEFLAYELLRSTAIVGSDYWKEILNENQWISDHFPQLLNPRATDSRERPEASILGQVLVGVVSRAWSRRVVNWTARWLTRIPFDIFRFVRRRDPAIAERQRFLLQAKFPYEFFQD